MQTSQINISFQRTLHFCIFKRTDLNCMWFFRMLNVVIKKKCSRFIDSLLFDKYCYALENFSSYLLTHLAKPPTHEPRTSKCWCSGGCQTENWTNHFHSLAKGEYTSQGEPTACNVMSGHTVWSKNWSLTGWSVSIIGVFSN